MVFYGYSFLHSGAFCFSLIHSHSLSLSLSRTHLSITFPPQPQSVLLSSSTDTSKLLQGHEGFNLHRLSMLFALGKLWARKGGGRKAATNPSTPITAEFWTFCFYFPSPKPPGEWCLSHSPKDSMLAAPLNPSVGPSQPCQRSHKKLHVFPPYCSKDACNCFASGIHIKNGGEGRKSLLASATGKLFILSIGVFCTERNQQVK